MKNIVAENERKIFSKNLNFYMNKSGISQADIVNKFNLTSSTVSDWCKGKKYPRADKVQLLADFLDILKSDLAEENQVDGNTIIFNHNGKIIKKKFSDEQMKYLEKFIESLANE